MFRSLLASVRVIPTLLGRATFRSASGVPPIKEDTLRKFITISSILDSNIAKNSEKEAPLPKSDVVKIHRILDSIKHDLNPKIQESVTTLQTINNDENRNSILWLNKFTRELVAYFTEQAIPAKTTPTTRIEGVILTPNQQSRFDLRALFQKLLVELDKGSENNSPQEIKAILEIIQDNDHFLSRVAAGQNQYSSMMQDLLKVNWKNIPDDLMSSHQKSIKQMRGSCSEGLLFFDAMMDVKYLISNPSDDSNYDMESISEICRAIQDNDYLSAVLPSYFFNYLSDISEAPKGVAGYKLSQIQDFKYLLQLTHPDSLSSSAADAKLPDDSSSLFTQAKSFKNEVEEVRTFYKDSKVGINFIKSKMHNLNSTFEGATKNDSYQDVPVEIKSEIGVLSKDLKSKTSKIITNSDAGNLLEEYAILANNFERIAILKTIDQSNEAPNTSPSKPNSLGNTNNNNRYPRT